MAYSLETIEDLIEKYLDKKIQTSNCYLRKNIILYIISADKPVTSDEIYNHLVDEDAVDTELISKKNFPKIVGKVCQNIPIIGYWRNQTVIPVVLEYHLDKRYTNMKDDLLKYIQNYKCS